MPGRPLPKANFGPNGLSVTYSVNGNEFNGYILKQFGTYQFVVTSDGIQTYLVRMAKDLAEAQNLPDGVCRLRADMRFGLTAYVREIRANHITTMTGEKVRWKVAPAEEANDEYSVIQPANTPPPQPIPPPTVISSNAVSLAENTPLEHILIASEPASWQIVGGPDAIHFGLASSGGGLLSPNLGELLGDENGLLATGSDALVWLSGTKNYEAAGDVGANNTYVVNVRATSISSGLTVAQTITVTVTDVVDVENTPVNTVLPAISGTTTQGQLLTTTNGTWTNSPATYAYQWKRNGVNISGAVGQTYVLAAGDVGATITVTVSATNLGGTGTITSNATATIQAAVSPPPVNTVAPVITGTTASTGNLTVSSNGTWTNSPSGYTYLWTANGVPISGATTNTLAKNALFGGQNIRCQVTATNAGGSASALSNTIGPIDQIEVSNNIVVPNADDVDFDFATLSSIPSGNTVTITSPAIAGVIFSYPII